jgi:hypothetical protein
MAHARAIGHDVHFAQHCFGLGERLFDRCFIGYVEEYRRCLAVVGAYRSRDCFRALLLAISQCYECAALG